MINLGDFKLKYSYTTFNPFMYLILNDKYKIE